MIDRLSIRDIRNAQYVQRWHMIQMNHRPSLADHSFQVAVLTGKIVSDCNIGVSFCDVLEYALCHDMSETAYGDIPSNTEVDKTPMERKFWGRDLHVNPLVKDVVKLADLLDNYLTFKECGVDKIQYIPNHKPELISDKLLKVLLEKAKGLGVLEYIKGVLNEKAL